MTAEILPSLSRSLLGRPLFDQMPDTNDQHWRFYNNGMPMYSPGQWSTPQQPTIYQQDGHHFSPSFGAPQPVVSPSLSFDTWPPSDAGMDISTPSPGDFTPEGGDFQTSRSRQSGHLHPHGGMHRHALSTPSVPSSNSGVSPHESHTSSPYMGRPPNPRSATAPDQIHRVSSRTSPVVKRISASDDDGDGEYMPNEEPTGTRGRKRQRIPHTAVERRYRENLNAHLDKLRQAVPALAARKGPDGGEGVKPSKCEVLNGAIEHIAAVDKENAALKNEVRRLHERIAEMEAWYGRGNSH